MLDERETGLTQKEDQLKQQDASLQAKLTEADELVETRRQKLYDVAKLDKEQAKKIVLDQLSDELVKERAEMIRNSNEEVKAKADHFANQVIVDAIQSSAADTVAETTVSVVDLPNEEMKGRIIGREGRNIRSFEALTGIDLIIDDTPKVVTLSGFDPIRREIAKRAMERLIKDGRIHPARIEEMVDKARKEVNDDIYEAGESALMELGIHRMNPELVKTLGRLKYRTSYGQNVLSHSIEVGKLAGTMAAELGLDEKLAVRAGLLHDIGKAIDFFFLPPQFADLFKAACAGKPLKVIIETCLLTEEEKIRMCDIVSRSDADFIKTSTGFSTAGATFEDVALMKAHMAPGKGIKAAGGIASLADAERFIELGATRLGTSRIVKIVKNEEATGY